MSDGADQDLARDLGFLEAYTIGLGTMIGAGIFVLPSIAANQAGPASMISFAVGGVVSLLAAISLSELATGMPRAGGSYYYINRAMGPFFGSIVGWGMWAGLMFASAFYMLGFGQYLTFFFDFGAVGIAGSALVMSVLLVAVNFYGVKETGGLQNLIVIALVGLILVFVTFGLLDGPTIGEFNPFGWGAVAATVGTVYVTFIGFEVIATSAEEIKNPSRNLPLSMIAAVVTPTLLYVLVMFISTGSLSIAELAASKIPVADVAEIFLGDSGALMMVIGAVLATVSSANASILSAARVNFAMGRDRILTNWLNEIHDRFRTPYRAIGITGLVILVLIAVGVGIGTLAEVASFMYLVTYSLVHVAVVVMRRAEPEAYDPAFEIPSILYPIVPALGLVSTVVIMFQMSLLVQGIGTLIILLGVGWYAVYARDKAPDRSLVGEALAPEPVPDAEDVYRVVVPIANPETERRLLELAAATASAHPGRAEIVALNVIKVPPQTSLEQDLMFEEERVERQQDLLEAARDVASDLDVGLRTRAVVGRSIGKVVLDVVDQEDADQVLLGWRGTRRRRDHVLGSNIDPIVGRAPCEVTLIKVGPEPTEHVVALAGQGPHAPVAARRAHEFAQAHDARLKILNVQTPDDEDEDAEQTPDERGTELIEELADQAGLEDTDYEPEVIVHSNVELTLLRRVDDFDTVCVGATRTGSIQQALFGSIPERIGEEADATVAMIRGPDTSPMSVREAILQRLSR